MQLQHRGTVGSSLDDIIAEVKKRDVNSLEMMHTVSSSAGGYCPTSNVSVS